jgi:hypothetical protein
MHLQYLEDQLVCKLGLRERTFKLEHRTETDILSEYEDPFTGLGCVAGVHHIQTDPDVTPGVHSPRKVPVALK